MAQNAGNLGMIVEHAHKKARPVKLTSLFNFGRLSGSDTNYRIQITEFVIEKML